MIDRLHFSFVIQLVKVKHFYVFLIYRWPVRIFLKNVSAYRANGTIGMSCVARCLVKIISKFSFPFVILSVSRI